MKQLLFFLMVSVNVIAQDYNYTGVRVILTTSESETKSFFHVYSPPYKAKAIYMDTTEALNYSPEQLMESLISAKNQSWVDYNTLRRSAMSKKYSESYFKKLQNIDTSKTFLELKAKYTFSFEDNDMAIIKYFFHTGDSKPVSGTYVLQKVGERWFYTSTPFTSELALVIMRFQEEKLAKILVGTKTGDKFIDEVIQKVKSKDGSIDLKKLVSEFNSWFTVNVNMSNYFNDPETW